MLDAYINCGFKIPENSCNGRSKRKLSKDEMFVDDIRLKPLMDCRELRPTHETYIRNSKYIMNFSAHISQSVDNRLSHIVAVDRRGSFYCGDIGVKIVDDLLKVSDQGLAQEIWLISSH